MQGKCGGALMWSVAVTGCAGPGVSRGVQTKVSPQLCFVGAALLELKQSEKAATCAVL